MNFKASEDDFENITYNIEILYNSLDRSSENIFRLVKNEINYKNLYDPKNDRVLDEGNNVEFEKFQAYLRYLNNHIYYNSLILVSFSIFETSFKMICSFVQDHIEPSKKFKDPEFRILESCCTYLSKDLNLINFNQDEIGLILPRIKKVNQFRNLIAHHNGNLLKDKTVFLEKQADYNIYKSNKQLFIFQTGQVFINDIEYIRSFIKDCKGFSIILVDKFKTMSI